jgi:hypothetical protein
MLFIDGIKGSMIWNTLRNARYENITTKKEFTIMATVEIVNNNMALFLLA